MGVLEKNVLRMNVTLCSNVILSLDKMRLI